MKQCNQCGKSKPKEQFYKRAASIDLLQPKCKSCCKVINQNFRETNPKYQNEWYSKNWNRWLYYVNEWCKENVSADDSRSALYYIVNPENKIYVGSTQTRFSYRKSAHKKEYRKKNGVMPYLHKSFDLYGYDKHKWVVIDMAGTDRETLHMIEYKLINHFNQLGMSLNKRLK